MRFNDVELSLMKGLFAGNEPLAFAIRKVMLQLPVTVDEIDLVKGSMNDTTFALMQKIFLPDLDGDAPMFQLTTMLIGLGGDIKDKDPDTSWPYIRAKKIEMDYVAQQVAVLNDLTQIGKEKIRLSDMKNLDYKKTQREDVHVNVLAFNFLISFVDSHLYQAVLLAGQKEETVEQTVQRLAKDSTK